MKAGDHCKKTLHKELAKDGDGAWVFAHVGNLGRYESWVWGEGYVTNFAVVDLGCADRAVGDPMAILDEERLICEGTARFDGCIHVNAGYWHYCDSEDIVTVAKMVQAIGDWVVERYGV